MKAKLSLLTLLLGASCASFALSPISDYQLSNLAQGGPATLKGVAESIHRSGSAEQEVTDALAQVVLENYNQGGKYYADALAWGVKALGSTHNARYSDTLKEVIEKCGDRKVVKYAKAALEELRGGSSVQYIKGSINLESIRNKTYQSGATTAAAPTSTNTAAPASVAPAHAAATTAKPVQAAPVAAPAQAAPAANTPVPITEAKIGMSMEEVFAICGAPTSTTSKMTGKAWIPFNYGGGDDVRMFALYKGQGRVVFNRTSRYSSVWKVLEVVPDPAERGYP